MKISSEDYLRAKKLIQDYESYNDTESAIRMNIRNLKGFLDGRELELKVSPVGSYVCMPVGSRDLAVQLVLQAIAAEEAKLVKMGLEVR